jgi:hypothetical protein
MLEYRFIPAISELLRLEFEQRPESGNACTGQLIKPNVR